MAAGARWGRAVAEGRTRRLIMVVMVVLVMVVMVVGRRRGREEEGRRRSREEERWSRMEGCGGESETASGASLQLHLGGSPLSLSLSLLSPPYLLITAKS